MEPSIKKYEVLVEFPGSGPVGSIIDVDAITYEADQSVITGAIAEGKIQEVYEHVIEQSEVDANPDAGLKVGDVVILPVLKTEEEMTDEEKVARDAGIKQLEDEAVVAGAESANQVAPAVGVEPSLVYSGKSVVRTSTRQVEGRTVHSITLETGEALDVSDKEYADMVEASLKP